MPKRGKNYKESMKIVDRNNLYDLGEAIELVQKTAKAKFDETIELSVRLGVDPRHADQQVRGAVVLPHGTGKTRKVWLLLKATNKKKLNKREQIMLEQMKWSLGYRMKVGWILML